MAALLIASISDEHGRECDKIIDDSIKELQKQNPSSLFHYTSTDGFKGIIENGTIWATDARHLNDPTEIIYGVKLARKFLEQKLCSMGKEERDFFVRLLDLDLEGIARTIAGYFTISFSLKQDDLNQWRSYADDGKGFSLEFLPASIDSLIGGERGEAEIENNHSTPSSFLISYDDEKLLNIIEDIYIKTKYYASSSPNDSKTKEIIAKNFSRSVFLISLYFKNRSYADEYEYRILLMGNKYKITSNTKYRIRKSSLVPYKDLRWKDYYPCPLKRIWIGPAAPHDTTPESVKEFLQCHGFDDGIDVVKSDIPYRAF